MIVINDELQAAFLRVKLARLDDWSEDLASQLAQQDNLPLTEDHWKLLNWIRAYYLENGTAPNLRVMQKMLKDDLGQEWSDKKRLFDLFPYGPAKQGARYAGMPKPTGCV